MRIWTIGHWTRTFEELLAALRAHMCAERLWWRCHRSLISDYLSALCRLEVVHILDANKTE